MFLYKELVQTIRSLYHITGYERGRTKYKNLDSFSFSFKLSNHLFFFFFASFSFLSQLLVNCSMLTFLLFLYFCLFAQAFYIKTELLRDTAQVHYESIVDTVLGQHNEKLLLELSQIIKDPHHLYKALKPEAELLLGSEPMQGNPNLFLWCC